MNAILVGAVAVLGGMAITLQGQFMGILDQSMGTRESVFITYASGGLVASLIMSALRGGNLRAWQGVPWYAFCAGLLGLVIVGSIGYVVPRLGLATAFTVLVASQFALAALIDQFGWFGALPHPLGLRKSLGMLVVLLGVWLSTR